MTPGMSRWWKRTLNASEAWLSPPTSPPGTAPPPRWSQTQIGRSSTMAAWLTWTPLSLIATASSWARQPSSASSRTAWPSWRTTVMKSIPSRCSWGRAASRSRPGPKESGGGRLHRRRRAPVQAAPQLPLQLSGQLGVVAQVAAGGRAATAELNRPVADRCPALGEQASGEAEVEEAGFGAEAVVAVHLQLAGLPGWGELVLGHLDPDAGADHPVVLGHAGWLVQ